MELYVLLCDSPSKEELEDVLNSILNKNISLDEAVDCMKKVYQPIIDKLNNELEHKEHELKRAKEIIAFIHAKTLHQQS